MTYVPRYSRPHLYFQHANLLFASGVPSVWALTEEVHIVDFVTNLQTCVFSPSAACAVCKINDMQREKRCNLDNTNTITRVGKRQEMED